MIYGRGDSSCGFSNPLYRNTPTKHWSGNPNRSFHPANISLLQKRRKISPRSWFSGGFFYLQAPPPGSIYRIWLAPVWNFSWSDSSFFRDYTSPICFFGGAGFPKWLEFGYWVWVRTAVFQKKIIKPIFPLYSSQESVEGKNIGGRTTLTKTQHNLSRSKNKRKKSRGKKKKTRHYN